MSNIEEFKHRLNILNKIEDEIDEKISPILKDDSSYPWGLLRQPLIGDETMEDEFQQFVTDAMTLWALGRYEFDEEGRFLNPEEGTDEATQLEFKHRIHDHAIERIEVYERIFRLDMEDVIKETLELKEGLV